MRTCILTDIALVAIVGVCILLFPFFPVIVCIYLAFSDKPQMSDRHKWRSANRK